SAQVLTVFVLLSCHFSGACDHIVLKQPEVVGIQEGETAVLPCHISPPNANLSKTTRRWWFGKRGSGTVGVFPLNNYSSPEHSGRVQLHDPGDRNSLSLELTRAQMSDQQTYFCSLSLIYNGDYQLVTGNGTTLFVYGTHVSYLFTVLHALWFLSPQRVFSNTARNVTLESDRDRPLYNN
uniref:Ig-like domain-containing protein n=1 Tax=Denticeps clupeoides TaxID=299321 RepID=A0AAY4AXK1_9TELE